MIRKLNDPRELRGLAILSQPNTVIQTGKDEWDVWSQSKDAYYHVIQTFPKDRKERMRSTGTWTCSCPDHTTRNVICKHIHAVQFSLKLKGEIEEQSTPVQIEEVEPKVTCAFCKSEKVVEWGYSENPVLALYRDTLAKSVT
jgi:putative transposase